MKVLFAASECYPFVKVGGLADVVGSLPAYLASKGMDVRVILPKYRDIPMHFKEEMQPLQYFYVHLGWRRQYCGIDMIKKDGIIYYFIDNEFYFSRDSVYGSGEEEGERFAFFSKAVLDAIENLGFKPDILHCNDWQTGMIPALLKIQYRFDDFYSDIKTVLTIHNLKFQGVFNWEYISELLGLGGEYFTAQYFEYFGKINFLKAGIVFADKVTTVSPTYAKEIQSEYYGETLDGLMRTRGDSIVGILNGINVDEYSSKTDTLIYANFDKNDLTGKYECKRQLQNELGLEQSKETPIIAVISRLTDQKGFDLIARVIEEIIGLNVQLVILGKGDESYQDLFSWSAWRYNGKMATCIEFNEELAHKIYASSDMFLMPSRFEPCGISQMIAMSYGTIPIVRETGGLVDSVEPYNKYTGSGNGFAFSNYNAHEMLGIIKMAVECYHVEDIWKGLIKNAMERDFSWESSAGEYEKLYSQLKPAKQKGKA